MEINLASRDMLDNIMELVSRAIEKMVENGIDQWGDFYPKQHFFETDIDNKELYVAMEDGRLLGVMALTAKQDPEYQAIQWLYGDKYRVIHRLAIDPAQQQQGIATRLMLFAEEEARRQGCESIRLDTYSGNPLALKLYDKLSYERRPGHVNFDKRPLPYYCFEKRL